MLVLGLVAEVLGQKLSRYSVSFGTDTQLADICNAVLCISVSRGKKNYTTMCQYVSVFYWIANTLSRIFWFMQLDVKN